MYGLASDSSSMTMNKKVFTDMAMTYNSTRTFNNVFVTGKEKIDELDMPRIIDSIWHYVRWMRSNNEARIKAMNQALLSKQKIPSIPTLSALALVPISVLAAPVIAVNDVVNYYARDFTDAWRRLLIGKLDVPVKYEMPSYIKLDGVGIGNFNGYFPGSALVPRRVIKRDIVDNADKLFETFVACIEEERSNSSVSEDSDQSTECETVDTEITALSAVDFEEEPVVRVNDDDLNGDIRKKFANRFAAYRDYYNQCRVVSTDATDGWDVKEIHKDAQAAMLEYAIYSLESVEVHADINTDPEFKSNVALKDAMGYILGMGYVFKAKPFAFASSNCADMMV
jgi:hypothetical protein